MRKYGDAKEFVDVDTVFVGMEFMDSKDFKNQGIYVIKKGFQYKLKPNAKERVKVICKYNKSQGCKGFIYASVRTGESTFVVRKFNLNHTYVTDHLSRNRAVNAEFVAQYLYDKIKRGDSMPLPCSPCNQFHTTHDTSIPYHVAGRARTMTLERLDGSYDESYKLVPAFCDMVEKTNPGSASNYTYGSPVFFFFHFYYKFLVTLYNVYAQFLICKSFFVV